MIQVVSEPGRGSVFTLRPLARPVDFGYLPGFVEEAIDQPHEHGAFHRLQTLANDENRKLIEIARIILTAEEALEPPGRS